MQTFMNIHMEENSVNKKVPSRAKSSAWSFFNIKKEINQKDKVVCSICGRHIVYHGGTSNLMNHLRANHPIQLQQMHDKKQQTLKDIILNETKEKKKRNYTRRIKY